MGIIGLIEKQCLILTDYASLDTVILNVAGK